MTTTIQISSNLQQELSKRKISDRDTYEEIIWDALEDTMELSEQTKKDIEEARKEIAAGKGIPLEEVKRKLNL
ncbi:hypothetical protein COT72_02530 [archaeon CG10_big_fil_rev_8_21_14_0_10_43_11]|nr:MAG: hypothetical protein COT72_02530 [archaeon CG10_big_fil_rev_8_21_14_0_10_43_11]